MPPPRRRALVLYASQTGTSEDLSEQLSATLERHRFSVAAQACDSLRPFSSLARQDLVLLLVSTTGQGELPDNARQFWRNLLRKKLPGDWLGRVKFGVFCLGDSTYPQFCWAGRKVCRRLLQLGAHQVVARGEGDGSGEEGIDGAFGYWVDELRNVLRVRWPLAALPLAGGGPDGLAGQDGLREIPDDVLLPPKWVLSFADSPSPPDPGRSETVGTAGTGGTSGTAGTGDAAETGEPAEKGGRDSGGDRGAEGDSDADGDRNAMALHVPRRGAVLATVARNERITPADHWQDVRHFSLALPHAADWAPGDSVALAPKNHPADVALFLALQGWAAHADRPLRLAPAPHLRPDEVPPSPLGAAPVAPLTLRTLLTHHLDITAIPRRSFFALAAHLTPDPVHSERLAEFADPQWAEELWDYTTRPRRSLLEVLHEFASVRLGLDRLLAAVPRLRERCFSVASSCAASNTTVDLLVAIVEYRTVIKKTRRGVCTRWLASLAPGSPITVVFHRGSLSPPSPPPPPPPRQQQQQQNPSPPPPPVVMVAPGTGLAPMRALIWQRVLTSTTTGASNILFFGCRNREKDFFFAAEWRRLQDAGHLTCFPAFSRDQKAKRYVQTVIREQGPAVWQALCPPGTGPKGSGGGGTVYVCGSSGRMPLAVRDALLDVFERCGSLTPAEARLYLAAMEKGGRYRQETW